ncbi:MAG: ferrous iron transporter B [Deltaproteobacteria bacterium]|nr:ferrous iron transporter B [Deltaproteobacteria bacterium]
MRSQASIDYLEPNIQDVIQEIGQSLRATYTISKHAIALLFLQKDEDIEMLLQKNEAGFYPKFCEMRERISQQYDGNLNQAIALSRQKKINNVVSETVHSKTISARTVTKFLDQFLMHPVLGYGCLAVVLYYCIYQFVGVFAAGTLVDLIETSIFEERINPWVTSWVTTIVPWQVVTDLFVGEYGVITLGIRYAAALVLPIVGAFFLMFSVIEDTGYLPRLSYLLDRIFKKIGLNGRAVIPMILGLGCDTMATMVTRVLETKREKIIATLLLALAIPCSAQLGLILALLSTNAKAMVLWGSVVSLEFLVIGLLAASILPGTKPHFYMEMPPLRLPKLSNVLSKTTARMKWYFLEVFPLFIFASVLIWAGILTGVFQWIVRAIEPLMGVLGLPSQMAIVMLFGFFRRDYGAAGLFDLQSQHLLTGNQLAIAAITLTLFLPCIAQFLIMKKERGLSMTLVMCTFVFGMAFGTGVVLNQLLTLFGVQL